MTEKLMLNKTIPAVLYGWKGKKLLLVLLLFASIGSAKDDPASKDFKKGQFIKTYSTIENDNTNLISETHYWVQCSNFGNQKCQILHFSMDKAGNDCVFLFKDLTDGFTKAVYNRITNVYVIQILNEVFTLTESDFTDNFMPLNRIHTAKSTPDADFKIFQKLNCKSLSAQVL